MNLIIEPYFAQSTLWPSSGRHILAQFDEETIVVYQAYRPSIGHFATERGYFGGPEFSFERMSWIKPNFLWMMYRSAWGTEPGQEVVLAVRLLRFAFDQLLAEAVHLFERPLSGRIRMEAGRPVLFCANSMGPGPRPTGEAA